MPPFRPSTASLPPYAFAGASADNAMQSPPSSPIHGPPQAHPMGGAGGPPGSPVPGQNQGAYVNSPVPPSHGPPGSPVPPSPSSSIGITKAGSQMSISYVGGARLPQADLMDIVPELSYGANPRMPSASSAIDLRFEPDKGRYFVATRDLIPGKGPCDN